MFDIDGAFVEFGLEAVALAEEVKWDKDVETTQMRFMNGSSAVAQTGCTYNGRIVVEDASDLEDFLFNKNNIPETLDITLTGIKAPKVVVFENAIIASVQSGIERPTEVEFTASALEHNTLW